MLRNFSGTVCGLMLLYLATANAVSATAANIIINHTNWDWYLAQPQTVVNAVATQKIFFAHASVGGNVMSGFGDLHGAVASRYPLAQISSGDTPPTVTVGGMIYEFNRGNPGWQTKVSDFGTYLSNGWQAPKVDFVMNKFCFIDQTADWTAYRDAMLALEAAYPTTKFVYWTMPIKTDADADEVLRAQFNTNLRNWMATQDHKILFDIADIEAWTAGGVHQTFLSGGAEYEQQVLAYSADGGHLNQTGYDRVALGLYSLFGQAATSGTTSPASPTPHPGITPGTGTPHPQATATPPPTVPPVQVFPNPAQSAVNFDIPTTGGGTVELRIYNFQGQLLGRKNAPSSGALRTTVAWNCEDLAPGVYLAQISVGGRKLDKLKFAVKH